MLSFCLKCKNITENLNLKVLKTKNGRTMLSPKCAVLCSKKKSRFLKEQEAKELLSSLGIETPLSNIPLCNYIPIFINSV